MSMLCITVHYFDLNYLAIQSPNTHRQPLQTYYLFNRPDSTIFALFTRIRMWFSIIFLFTTNTNTFTNAFALWCKCTTLCFDQYWYLHSLHPYGASNKHTGLSYVLSDIRRACFVRFCWNFYFIIFAQTYRYSIVWMLSKQKNYCNRYFTRSTKTFQSVKLEI